MTATSTPPDLTAIKLPRTYRFNDDEHDKMADWGLQLWRLLRAKLEFNRPRLLRDSDETEFIIERYTNYALTRLVTRGMMVEKRVAGLGEEARQDAFLDLVEDMLAVDEQTRGRVVWLLDRICARHKRNGGDLTRAQCQTISGFAVQQQHRCYICGQALSFLDHPHPQAPVNDTEPDWRRFEIEHIFPQSKGGGRNKSNLAACCQSCNKLKDDYLSFADLPLEDYITSSEDASNVRRTFGSKGRFALLWRQRGKCAMCDTPFYDVPDEKLVLRKRDIKDTYHFMNAELVCGKCAENDDPLQTNVKSTGLNFRE
jgi:hypothetical protein